MLGQVRLEQGGTDAARIIADMPATMLDARPLTTTMDCGMVAG